ncbi:MAG: metallophosphoesterase [Proteobacteria bacterium]|nr:metallophosphoesterase [Pseudomonadota bacterium]
MRYDIIGDVHGHADKLTALLRAMGYRETQGAWRHSDAMALFVGDFIDRGPGQLATIDTVRRMLDAGSALAIMGNHEFNAISWHTPDDANPGAHLRPRNDLHRGQHAAFLSEIDPDSAQHQELVDWFYTLPLWLELPGLRLIHACWHPRFVAEFAPMLAPGHRIKPEQVAAANREGTFENRAIETLLKGMEVILPDGQGFHDKGGHFRTETRIRWWDRTADTYRKAAILSDAQRATIPDTPIPQDALLGYDGDVPVFFGHYWWTGTPAPLAPRAACVDYSAGKGGPLVAYRWDGEQDLDARKFVSV